jgi:hypothetical protein
MHTFAPASANCFAIANPKPTSSATPATKTRLPVKSIFTAPDLDPNAALINQRD